MEDLDALRTALMAAVAGADDAPALEGVRIAALGRKGRVTALMKGLGEIEADQRKSVGAALNQLKDAVAAAIEARSEVLADAALDARLVDERVDITLPARPQATGRVHPISQTIDEVIAIFGEMGFSVAEGPDIEDDWHNFTALNIPPEHPARQEHDTFYLPGTKDGARMLLRTPYFAGADPHHDEDLPAAFHHRAGGVPTAATRTPPTRPCSTRWRAWWSTRAPISATSRAV